MDFVNDKVCHVWFGQFICVYYAFIWTDPNCFADTCNIKACDIGIKNRNVCAQCKSCSKYLCSLFKLNSFCVFWAQLVHLYWTQLRSILLGLCVRVCAFCFRLCNILFFSFIFSHVLHARCVLFYVVLCFVCFCLLGLFCHKYLIVHAGFLAYHFDDEFFRGSLPLCLRVYVTA